MNLIISQSSLPFQTMPEFENIFFSNNEFLLSNTGKCLPHSKVNMHPDS